MAIIEIREYAFIARDGRGSAAPLPVEPAVAVQRLDNVNGTITVVSAPFNAATTYVTIGQDPKVNTPYSVERPGQGADPDPETDEQRGVILAEDLPKGMGVAPGGRIAVR